MIGGHVTNVFEYIKRNGGLAKESDYAYTGSVGSCKYSSSMSAVKVKDYLELDKLSVDQIKKLLFVMGPLVVVMDSADPSFITYRYGIYKGSSSVCSSTDPNHAMLLVGYGSEKGVDFWYEFLVSNL